MSGNKGETKGRELWQVAVDEHNKYRRRHGVPPVKGDDEQIHTVAQRYAEYLAKYDLFQHSNNSPYGENLAGALGDNEADAIRFAVKMWYDEINCYNYGCPGFSMQTGHFTQVVWKSTTRVGIGVSYNPRKRWWVVVGNYSPPGNFQGRFPENVPRLLSAADLRKLEEQEQEKGKKDEGECEKKDEGGEESESESGSEEGSDFKSESEEGSEPEGDKDEGNEKKKPLPNKLWQVAVDEHNKYRRLHGVQLIKGDDETIHNVAQNYANFLASRNCFQHSNNQAYGENLAGVQGTDEADAIRNAIKMWYDEVKQYNFSNPGFSGATGHFTQVIWKKSTHVGIGVAYNRCSRWWVVVANYSPQGNVMTQFGDNVPRLVPASQLKKDEEEDKKKSKVVAKLKELKLDDHDDDNDKEEEGKCESGPEDKSDSEEETPPKKLKNELWQIAVDEHNKYRRRHGVPDIQGDDENIHNVAQNYANYLASSNRFQHSNNRAYGENLAGAQGSSEGDAIRQAVKMWYDEINCYNFNRQGFSSGTGHFTQVVWKGSTHLGIGVAYNSRSRWWVVVANYSPPGNMMGSFPQNVFPPCR